MAENAVPTLAPKQDIPDILDALPTSTQVPLITPEQQALFDSIAHDETASSEGSEASPLKAVFAGFLWFGYAVAIVVALMLVWSAANGLLKSLPR
jgi:hypothetical protein